MSKRPKRPRGIAEITAEARERTAEHEWLILNEPPIVLANHDGTPEYWVAAWIKVPDND